MNHIDMTVFMIALIAAGVAGYIFGAKDVCLEAKDKHFVLYHCEGL